MLMLFPPAVVGLDRVLIPIMPFRPWGVVSYMFLHAGIGHVFFNMLALFFFGPRLELKLGARGFLTLYFVSGLGAAAFSLLFAWNSPVVGSSGAVYGVLMGYAMFWPKEPIYIWAILPIQARWLAAGLIAISLYSGISGSSAGVADFAHLGGLVVGAAYVRARLWKQGKGKREFQRKLRATQSAGSSDRETKARWASITIESLHEINRGEVEELLARVESGGVRSLSQDERDFLDRMTGF
jgi:rhomboid family protein